MRSSIRQSLYAATAMRSCVRLERFPRWGALKWKGPIEQIGSGSGSGWRGVQFEQYYVGAASGDAVVSKTSGFLDARDCVETMIVKLYIGYGGDERLRVVAECFDSEWDLHLLT